MGPLGESLQGWQIYIHCDVCPPGQMLLLAPVMNAALPLRQTPPRPPRGKSSGSDLRGFSRKDSLYLALYG